MTKKEVTRVLSYANSYTRFPVFLALSIILKDKLYWYALRNAYANSDDLFKYKRHIKIAFLRPDEGKQYLMTLKERRFLDKLPEQITIYRGMTKIEQRSEDFGISWSLKKEVALYFANGYKRNHSTKGEETVVHELKIFKRDVIAFFNPRDEFEVIYIHKLNLH